MYTLEDTKNMSRALRHDDFETFKSLLTSEERFSPWLDHYQSGKFLDIFFAWLDANFITTPANDVENVFISALADKLIDSKNWPVAYACLTCLPDSPKALKKRTQCFDSYVESTPDCSIELAFHKFALDFYNNNSLLDEKLRLDAITFHDLALHNFAIDKLRDAMKGRIVEGRDVVTPLDALASLLFALDKKNWNDIQIAAKRLSHPLAGDDAFAWLEWFASNVVAGALDDELTIIVAWSDVFWPLIRDPLHLRDRMRALYPTASQIIATKESPSVIKNLSVTDSDKLPQTAILRAMLVDDSRMVTKHSDAIEALHPVVSSLLAAWLNVMDAPNLLAQTIRAALKQHPSYINLYAMAFAHECVANNEKITFAKELFPLGDNALCLLNAFRNIVSNAFTSVQRTYIASCQPDDTFSSAVETNNDILDDDDAVNDDSYHSMDALNSQNTHPQPVSSTALKQNKVKPIIIIGFIVIIIAALLTVL